MNPELTKRLQHAFKLTQQITALETELTELMGGKKVEKEAPETKLRKKYTYKVKNDPIQVKDATLRAIDRFGSAPIRFLVRELSDGGIKIKAQGLAQVLRRLGEQKVIQRSEAGNWSRVTRTVGGFQGSPIINSPSPAPLSGTAPTRNPYQDTYGHRPTTYTPGSTGGNV